MLAHRRDLLRLRQLRSLGGSSALRVVLRVRGGRGALFPRSRAGGATERRQKSELLQLTKSPLLLRRRVVGASSGLRCCEAEAPKLILAVRPIAILRCAPFPLDRLERGGDSGQGIVSMSSAHARRQTPRDKRGARVHDGARGRARSERTSSVDHLLELLLELSELLELNELLLELPERW